MDEFAIKLKDVRRTYRTGPIEVPALRGVSLSIAAGEFAATAGPSGSGKTTLLNIIGGLDRADTGEIWVAGRTFNCCLQVSWRICVCSASALSSKHTTCCLSLPLWKTRNLLCSSRGCLHASVEKRSKNYFQKSGSPVLKIVAPPSCPAVSNNESPSLARWLPNLR